MQRRQVCVALVAMCRGVLQGAAEIGEGDMKERRRPLLGVGGGNVDGAGKETRICHFGFIVKVSARMSLKPHPQYSQIYCYFFRKGLDCHWRCV